MHNVCLQLIGLRSIDGRQQNIPTCSEVSTIIVGDFAMKISTIYVIIYVQKFQKPFYIKVYSIIRATHGQPSSKCIKRKLFITH